MRHCLLLNVHLCLAKYPAQDYNILSSACCEGHLWASYSCNKHNCHFTLVRIIPVWLKTVWTSLYLLLVWHAFNCYNIWCLFVFSALMRMLVISPHLVTDKVYLHKAVKHAIKCGVIDQWMLARERGFLPKERADPTSEQYEVRFITEKEYRTLPDAMQSENSSTSELAYVEWKERPSVSIYWIPLFIYGNWLVAAVSWSWYSEELAYTCRF